MELLKLIKIYLGSCVDMFRYSMVTLIYISARISYVVSTHIIIIVLWT